jgi:hypothetical protein
VAQTRCALLVVSSDFIELTASFLLHFATDWFTYLIGYRRSWEADSRSGGQ